MDVVVRKPLARWRLISAIIYKEILTILHHPYHLISLLMPLFVSVVFLFLVPTLDRIDTIEVMIVDQGSSSLPAALAALPDLSVIEVDSETTLFEAVDDRATAGFIIPAGFDTAVAHGETPTLTVYLNSDARSSSIAKFQRFFVEETAALRDPSPPAHINWQERHLEGSITPEFSISGFLFTTLILLSVSIITCSTIPHLVQEEREQGTLQAVLASPASLVDSLIGKGLTAFILTMSLALIVSLMNDGFVGNWPLTAAAIVSVTLFMIGLGLFLGLNMHKNRIKAAATAAVMIAALPSWFAVTPIESLAPIPALILRAIPTQYFVAALRHSLNSQPWGSAAADLLIILVWTVVIYLLLGWRVRQFDNTAVSN